jgi:hypothetical protein
MNGIIERGDIARRRGGAAGHCPTLGPKVGFAGPPYGNRADH